MRDLMRIYIYLFRIVSEATSIRGRNTAGLINIARNAVRCRNISAAEIARYKSISSMAYLETSAIRRRHESTHSLIGFFFHPPTLLRREFTEGAVAR